MLSTKARTGAYALIGASFIPAAALAHTAADAAAYGSASAWWSDVAGAVLVTLLALVYAVGQWQVARRARARRSGHAACFWAGWATLTIALTPPLDRWSGVSFAAHMTQHELMMLIAAPLLVVARPLGTLMWGLPNAVGAALTLPRLRRIGAWLAAPLVAWLLHAVVLWAWHVPGAFEAGLRSVRVHWLQHASFFAVAIIYWWSVFSSSAGLERKGMALLSVFTTAVHTAVLGMLLTFSTQVWYPSYADVENPWGLPAVEDQQLGGLIMWVPGGMVFIIAALVLAAQWLKHAEMRAARSS
jgi:putative membrane protein